MRRLVALLVTVALLATACSEATPDVDVPEDPNRTPVVIPSTSTTVPSTTSPPSTTAPDTSTTSSTTSTTTTTTTVPITEVSLELQPVASGFSQPLLLTAPPGDERLFVVDQPGRIWVVTDDDPSVFLDIRDDVSFRGERGLLGLAFAPDFADSGIFYVNYTDTTGATVVASFVADGDTADPASRTIHLTVEQPASNHNGGNLVFGPDGHLWIGMGDGGGADDRFGHGQLASTQLGSMLRIEPTADGFVTPERSPAITTDAAPGVWAIGLRNPWRFAFDGDLLYVADVGQNRVEEISIVDVLAIDSDPRLCIGCVPLPNFGWPIQEGSECFRQADCDTAGLIQPIVEYTHDEGCAITGGIVYRGDAIPSLQGHYFYGDLCGGWIRSFAYDGSEVRDDTEWFRPGSVPRITSFGQDGAGELYAVSADGHVFRIVAAP
jgi:glucose/arabinose dehydrogenase